MAKRGRKSNAEKAAIANAADAALQTITDTDAGAETFAPAGNQPAKIQNTIRIVPSEGIAGNGKEVFLMKKWDDGTIFYVDPAHLDTIDRKRLSRALRRANSQGVELWVILKDTTLSNSKNALEYFHQLTRTFKPEGAIMAPTAEELTQRIARTREGFIERAGLTDAGDSYAPNSML